MRKAGPLTTYSNSITLGNILTVGAMIVSVTLAYSRLATTDETLGIRLTTQEVNASAQSARLGAIESTLNSQAISSATLTAQLAAVRESLAELKSSQAETNRLLRNLSASDGTP